MGKIIFECESVTPMFMYGADGATPELRPASIKGLMRFWWRAVNGDNDIEKLKKAEGEVFGSTDRRSKISIRTSIDGKPITKKVSELKNEKIAEYLYFSLYMQTKKDKDKKYFDNLKFKVIISSYNDGDLKEACYSFILLSLFGGLGSRSRRGGGSFRINIISDKGYETLLLNNSQNIKKTLKNSYATIKDFFQRKYSNKTQTKIYHNINHLNFQISSNYKSWEDALTNIEEKYKDFRDKNSILSNASFGLPIMRPKIFTRPKVDRLASPIIIKILKVKNNYYWLVLKLEGNNLKDYTKISFTAKNKEKIERKLNRDILDKFLNEGLNNE